MSGFLFLCSFTEKPYFCAFYHPNSEKMKKIYLIILLMSASLMLQAQNDTIRPPRLKVGVVLGGGGAKGASHIGVLKYLEEMGIPVDYVAGTSMGSIIGGLYAMGYEPNEMTRLISNIQWNEMIGNKIDRTYLSKDMRERRSTNVLNIPFGDGSLRKQAEKGNLLSQLPSAYVNNSSLINLFNDLCVGYQEEMDFDDMPIPFACVATDLITGKEVVLRHGVVPTAMRASMAIPGVFAPVEMGDCVLVDGGLVNNFPADVLKEMGADIIIGVEVTSEKGITANDLKSLPQVMGRLLINTTSAKRKENRELCDIRIVPDITGFGMLSFTPEAIDTLVNRGYQQAEKYHDKLLAIKQRLDAANGTSVGKQLHAPKALNLMQDSVFISSIKIEGISGRESRWLIRKGDLKAGRFYSNADIEQKMSIFRGTGSFDEITYTVKENDSLHLQGPTSNDYDLTVNVKRSAPHVMGLGLRYDTEEGAALRLGINFNEKRFGASKFGLQAKLSYNPKLSLYYTYSRSSLANFNVTADYRDEHFRTRGYLDKYINLHYLQMKASASISEFHLLNFSTNVGASFIYTTYDKSSFEASTFDEYYFKDNTLLAPFVRMQYDNLDDPYFANHGILANLSNNYYYLTSSKEKYFDINYTFQAYITPANGRFSIIPQVYGRYIGSIVSNASLVQYYNLRNVGGGEIAGRHFENQMPFIGLTSVEDGLDESNVSILRLDLRYNFYGKHYLTAMYNTSVPWGMLGTGGMSFSDIFNFMTHGAGLKYSYNSILGPISLTAHWSNYAEKSRFGGYFSFGYTF